MKSTELKNQIVSEMRESRKHGVMASLEDVDQMNNRELCIRMLKSLAILAGRLDFLSASMRLAFEP
ncbi:hypothetical protein DV532_28475 (plasmid) [Pseudomonas sp. Leaf58]|uniref:hypothetical protein n=1 Tax=Pseudomonas sp. Leaf58 TaxID=1736226 RepID=UPI0006FD85B7|nr:hypothetical protein [Pseudomonas sp. Leaf58]AYG48206.1 hypothetical protein DV532_28475 [Pseudomonas sp. Leaf58]KQN62245.1 hypothetical protein ASF02_08765 [Pseudomonas sp. Leaf58]